MSSGTQWARDAEEEEDLKKQETALRKHEKILKEDNTLDYLQLERWLTQLATDPGTPQGTAKMALGFFNALRKRSNLSERSRKMPQ